MNVTMEPIDLRGTIVLLNLKLTWSPRGLQLTGSVEVQSVEEVEPG